MEERALFADAPIDQLAYDVQVSDVSRIFLEQVREDPAQRIESSFEHRPSLWNSRGRRNT